MALQERFHVSTSTAAHRLELSDGLSAADDREMLAAVFDSVEKVGEVAGSVGSGDLRHEIMLSDSLVRRIADELVEAVTGRTQTLEVLGEEQGPWVVRLPDDVVSSLAGITDPNTQIREILTAWTTIIERDRPDDLRELRPSFCASRPCVGTPTCHAKPCDSGAPYDHQMWVSLVRPSPNVHQGRA